MDADRSGGGEVTILDRIWPFMKVEPSGEFGDQPVDIGPPLTVAMAALVDEHSVDGGAEIGAMIEVKAAQIILVGLALAAVLTDDQARGCLEQLARPIDLACSELLCRDDAGIGGIGDTKLTKPRAGDNDRAGSIGRFRRAAFGGGNFDDRRRDISRRGHSGVSRRRGNVSVIDKLARRHAGR
jgi:hypothetical protein